jgi:hemoglobin
VFVHLETHRNSLYERVGGLGFFTSLVDRFYEGVAADPLLRPLYPDDLRPPRRRLALFLAQYWGGPQTYSEERGHPRLRMRHLRFRIGEAERVAWLGHMDRAVAASGARPADAEALRAYFASAASSLLNAPEQTTSADGPARG